MLFVGLSISRLYFIFFRMCLVVCLISVLFRCFWVIVFISSRLMLLVWMKLGIVCLV